MYEQGIDPLNLEEDSSGGVHFGGDASDILKMFFGGGSPFGFSSGEVDLEMEDLLEHLHFEGLEEDQEVEPLEVILLLFNFQ